jgi:hypothetical protein
MLAASCSATERSLEGAIFVSAFYEPLTRCLPGYEPAYPLTCVSSTTTDTPHKRCKTIQGESDDDGAAVIPRPRVPTQV